MGEYMKKFILLMIVGVFFASIFAVDAQAAKKSSKKSKISQEFLTETDNEINRLTTKIYGKALLSPKDNESLITIKIKLDTQMIQDSAPELAPLYYKTGNILKLRDMNKDAIEWGSGGHSRSGAFCFAVPARKRQWCLYNPAGPEWF